MDLRGKVAIITGASSGIGRATAENLHEAGMNLVLTACREERLQALKEKLNNTVIVPGDITDPELPEDLINTAHMAYVVLNTAGLLETAAIDKVDIDRVCRMVRVNVEAAFRMAYVALRHFLSTGHGHLINTSSVVGTKVRLYGGWYAATKYAIEGLSEALRMEFAGTDIQISCVEPGLVVTELHSHWEVPPAKAFNISEPLTAEDIARSVRFILEQPSHVRIPRLMILPGDQQI